MGEIREERGVVGGRYWAQFYYGISAFCSFDDEIEKKWDWYLVKLHRTVLQLVELSCMAKRKSLYTFMLSPQNILDFVPNKEIEI